MHRSNLRALARHADQPLRARLDQHFEGAVRPDGSSAFGFLDQSYQLIFEDLHWIDEQTQELLDLLADSIGSSKFLLLGTTVGVFASME